MIAFTTISIPQLGLYNKYTTRIPQVHIQLVYNQYTTSLVCTTFPMSLIPAVTCNVDFGDQNQASSTSQIYCMNFDS